MAKRKGKNKQGGLPTTVPAIDLPPVPGVVITNPGAMAKSAAAAQALPQKNAIRRAKGETRRDTRRGIRTTNKSFGALDRTLDDIMGDYGDNFGAGLSQYNQAIAGLGPLFGGAGPIGEMAAAATQAGALTAGAQGLLANQYATSQGQAANTRRAAAVERKNTVQNFINRMHEVIKGLNERLMDVSAEQGANAAAYKSQYQSDLFNQRMARYQALLQQAQMQGDQQLAQVLLDAINREYGAQRQGGAGGGGMPNMEGQGVSPYKAPLLPDQNFFSNQQAVADLANATMPAASTAQAVVPSPTGSPPPQAGVDPNVYYDPATGQWKRLGPGGQPY